MGMFFLFKSPVSCLHLWKKLEAPELIAHCGCKWIANHLSNPCGDYTVKKMSLDIDNGSKLALMSNYPADQFPLDIEASFGNHIYVQIGLFVYFVRKGSSVPYSFIGSVRQQIFFSPHCVPGRREFVIFMVVCVFLFNVYVMLFRFQKQIIFAVFSVFHGSCQLLMYLAS